MKDMVNTDTLITIDQWYNHPLDTFYIGISTTHTNVYQTSYHLKHINKFISQHIVATTCHTFSTKTDESRQRKTSSTTYFWNKSCAMHPVTVNVFLERSDVNDKEKTGSI